MPDNDISLAIRLENLTLLESVFHTQMAPSENAQVQMQIVNPENRFDVDVKSHRTVLRATVGLNYTIMEDGAGAAAPEEGAPIPLLFNVLLGVVVSVPFMEGAAIGGAAHLAGAADNATAQRDKAMEQAMRVEAIKATHAYATNKLAEQSAMSPLGQIALPLIDADQILVDIMKNDAEAAR